MSAVRLPLCVGLPTRDRRQLALAALASVVDRLQPGDELLVADNGSQDGTAEAVADWLAAHCPHGRVLTVSAGGVSMARNAVLRETAAPIACFLDDDERAEPGWLAALRRA